MKKIMKTWSCKMCWKWYNPIKMKLCVHNTLFPLKMALQAVLCWDAGVCNVLLCLVSILWWIGWQQELPGLTPAWYGDSGCLFLQALWSHRDSPGLSPFIKELVISTCFCLAFLSKSSTLFGAWLGFAELMAASPLPLWWLTFINIRVNRLCCFHSLGHDHPVVSWHIGIPFAVFGDYCVTAGPLHEHEWLSPYL